MLLKYAIYTYTLTYAEHRVQFKHYNYNNYYYHLIYFYLPTFTLSMLGSEMSESNTSMSSISWLYSCSPITSTSSGSSKLTILALTFLRRFPRWKRCTCLVARSNTPYDDDADVDHNYSLKGDISIAEVSGAAFQYTPLSLNHIQAVELIHKYDVYYIVHRRERGDAIIYDISHSCYL